jgi:hypothetical protein
MTDLEWICLAICLGTLQVTTFFVTRLLIETLYKLEDLERSGKK